MHNQLYNENKLNIKIEIEIKSRKYNLLMECLSKFVQCKGTYLNPCSISVHKLEYLVENIKSNQKIDLLVLNLKCEMVNVVCVV